MYYENINTEYIFKGLKIKTMLILVKLRQWLTLWRMFSNFNNDKLYVYINNVHRSNQGTKHPEVSPSNYCTLLSLVTLKTF